jgi:hypothetical protein
VYLVPLGLGNMDDLDIAHLFTVPT